MSARRSAARLAALAAAASLAACAASPFAHQMQPGAAKGAAAAPATSPPSPAQEALAREQEAAANAAAVTGFFDLVFRERRVDEAISRYGGDRYIQHSPGAPSGWQALRDRLAAYFRANPLASSQIERVVAQGDMVVLHVLAKDDPVDPGRAVVDFFRLEGGKIVEHWDVVQRIPAGTKNPAAMF